ncbi:glycerol-3-phosphate 1-O-acyltransferase PlsY [Oleiharenicola lentus]|uniref:glycerol-3-phosphate 1-O-acyltransferase PlsY n=1 Tax=Oleiharenicola lentus TaxID=2508720 RepID=UPI003F67875A
MPHAWLIASALVGYVLGSLPFGWLVARAHGVDIFKVGSGNPGATNVKRVLGSKAGNTVFALDAVKGALAAGWPMLPFFAVPDPRMAGLVGVIAAVLGHSFSMFTKFKGGKGVATAAGGLVVLIPISCLIGAAVWVITFFVSRYVSLASILAAVAVPAASWLRGNPLSLNIVATALGLFVIIRHRENLKRLLNGTESRFSKKKPTQP